MFFCAFLFFFIFSSYHAIKYALNYYFLFQLRLILHIQDNK